METISAAILKSSITDLKSHSSSSIATMPGDHSQPSSPALPTKTRSFDDRECLRAVASTVSARTSEANASCVGGVDCLKTDNTDDDAVDDDVTRKSSENISLHCEINEPNTNIRHENISSANANASDTNLESSSCLSDDGEKVHSSETTITLSASPPTITVICAPCTDDILAETAAQTQQIDQPSIECDSEGTAQPPKNMNETQPSTVPESSCTTTAVAETSTSADDAKTSTAHTAAAVGPYVPLTLDVKKRKDDVAIQQDDLSPSMDEYEDCNPTGGDYQFDTVTGELLMPGCVAPAPTPAPLIAPLAEIEIDPPDDEMSVSGIEKQQSSDDGTINIAPTANTSQQQQQQSHPHPQQPHTSHTKKKKQKSTDKGERRIAHSEFDK